MAASTKHILTNVERMAGDDELLKLWNAEAHAKNDDDTERTAQQSWLAFIQAADEAKIADRIPGITGRTFTAKYADERKAESAGPRAPQVAKKPSGAAPAAAGSSAGGSRRMAREAAPAAEKKAVK
ncbi:hypothetical protein GUY44_26945 [Pimelobacter simplex]|uniref:hypothetical protein n=1 Tax=Nocardioides simplex TaxID=2045 RepID=UPI000535E179|nr:hypothetical protein [Pimelobacter simplex]MCG8154140.1 hypothetical protein [Pimelobacter simplex]GEB15547.1 hypothetical protein NSI01_38620 [Pimelobacter simplex]SFM58419.1 hypothetical protein SAMN05421671_2538 [Pimelobacter simplex]